MCASTHPQHTHTVHTSTCREDSQVVGQRLRLLTAIFHCLLLKCLSHFILFDKGRVWDIRSCFGDGFEAISDSFLIYILLSNLADFFFFPSSKFYH